MSPRHSYDVGSAEHSLTAAESLGLHENTQTERADARLTVRRHATDDTENDQFLFMLGLHDQPDPGRKLRHPMHSHKLAPGQTAGAT